MKFIAQGIHMLYSPSGTQKIGIKKVAKALWYHRKGNRFRDPFCLGSNVGPVAFTFFSLFEQSHIFAQIVS